MVLQLIEVKSRDPICIGNRYFVSRGKILNNSYHFGAACLTGDSKLGKLHMTLVL